MVKLGKLMAKLAKQFATRGKGAELAPSGHTQRDGAQPVKVTMSDASSVDLRRSLKKDVR